ncbi:hypothetical protein F66182_13035 [Fusarium sp. NRRL 66182]|nr:hypothetical protein F66182_13035 [Fusarium sp. NRRL 66182]
MVHATYLQWVKEHPGMIASDTPKGQELRERLAQHVAAHDGENQDHGIEMGYRYSNSPVIVHNDDDLTEPEWTERKFVPSTWPGSRAPHVYLQDGQTSIFDLFGIGSEFTLVDFTSDARFINLFQPEIRKRGMPCKFVNLTGESHVRKVWERDAVLVRPDDHIAWRAGPSSDVSDINAEDILNAVLGVSPLQHGRKATKLMGSRTTPFTSTTAVVPIDSVEGRGEFQK